MHLLSRAAISCLAGIGHSVAHRDENRFRSDKSQKKQLPINSPILIRSDRIATKNDPDSITDKRGVNAEHPCDYTAITLTVAAAK